MTPEAVLLAFTAFCNAVAESAKLAQTPAGQKAIEKSLADQTAFQANLKALGVWFQKLFTGQLT